MSEPKSFTPVEGCAWIDNSKHCVGRYRDIEGYGRSGVYFKDFRYTRQAVVLSNGHFMKKYSYPLALIPTPFNSDMHNWNNLHYSGKWNIKGPDGKEYNNSERLINDIYFGRLPMGFTTVHKYDLNKTLEQLYEFDLESKVTNVDYSNDYSEIVVSITGKVHEHININLAIDYINALGKCAFGPEHEILSLKDIDYVTKEANKSFKKFFTGYDFNNPSTYGERMLNGLLLGQPAEAIFADIAIIEKSKILKEN